MTHTIAHEAQGKYSLTVTCNCGRKFNAKDAEKAHAMFDAHIDRYGNLTRG